MNDHNPEFERQNYYATVPENSPVGTKILEPKAWDKDAGLNAKLRFSLHGEKLDRFHINVDSGVITTAVILDREETSLYHITLMAQDSSVTEPRAFAVNLTIAVLDINDNSPAFSSSKFDINIPDRIKSGQFVYGALAVDPDEGNNSRIIYSISGSAKDKFSINANTGVIKTAQELALDGQATNRAYNLIIHAHDQGAEPRSASTELNVILYPAQLFPTFSYMVTTQFTLSEDLPENNIVTKLTASSPKRGAVANINYSIAGGNVRDALKIDSTTGELAISNFGLDYETLQQYEIYVQASDSDRPSLRSVVRITINVTDTNDNAPVMEKLIYNSNVMEEEPPPLLVTKVSAVDRDSGENGIVTYRLKNDFDGSFEIDADSGEVFTRVRLDREDVPNFELIVEAVDQGLPQQTGTASVLVQILDKNDNPPRFTRLFSVNVTENAEIGSFVIKVTSSDLDIGDNANATYNFADNPGSKFSIDPITGNVTVAGHLDREQQDEFILKVAAVDGAWRAETPLTITL